jgi:hypothetical protein
MDKIADIGFVATAVGGVILFIALFASVVLAYIA